MNMREGGVMGGSVARIEESARLRRAVSGVAPGTPTVGLADRPESRRSQ
jgi:hypothetical protein